MFKTINEKYESSEIVQKKSKFIADIFYVETATEAEEKIKIIKKKYYDSRHNCFAYRIYSKTGIIQKFSDDGEPSGTAGGPMLNILESKGICNVLVIVTRYFGGILLGTGGLVRAYSEATEEVLNKCNIKEKEIGVKLSIEVKYSDLEKIKYYLNKNNIRIIGYEFLENVKINTEISNEKLDLMLKSQNTFNFEILKIDKGEETYI